MDTTDPHIRLAEEQALVEGPIDVLDQPAGDAIIILNDEGRDRGLAPNRRIGDGIVIHGPFLICGRDPDGDTVALTEEQVCCYKTMYSV